MNVVRYKPWKPFGDFVSMHNSLNRFFGDGFDKHFDRGADTIATRYPTTDIYETTDDYIVKLEVPGLSKDDISVELNNDTLTVKGERKEEKELNEESYHRLESFSGTFSRSFTLPKNVDAQKISADMKDGILNLKIAKAEIEKIKSIPIEVK
ncbi:MAG: Hsp20/alpha crystallin family protein [bacterium]|nr:Hsp20/alpha crystallin family protein [bacterium]